MWDAKTTVPARLIVRLIEIPTSSVPALADYQDVMKRCLKAANAETEKEQLFFKQAIDLLAKPKLKVLQFQDFNTTGVTGPCSNGTPYYALMKASGQSKKNSGTSIGSFGIGKYAPYASSQLRTVFVSTVWKDQNSYRHYVQGKSILMSHVGADNKTRRGVGYWGQENHCLPVDGLSNLPPWLQRASPGADLAQARGTTLSILGFEAIQGWHEMLTATLAENFFGAIASGGLEVDIDGKYHLNKDTIGKVFTDTTIIDAISGQMKGEPDQFQNSAFFLEAISQGSSALVLDSENAHLGRCELKLLVREKLPKRVAVLRDGMLITQELEGLRRFGNFKDFTAVLECKSEKGNALLRAMEPPKHNDFEPDRLPTRDQKRAGRVALRELSRWVREMLERHARDPVSAVTNIDELKDFFADEEGATENGRTTEENPAGRIIVRARPMPKPDKPKPWDVESRVGSEDDDGEEDEERDNTGGNTRGGGPEGNEEGGPEEGDTNQQAAATRQSNAGTTSATSNTGGRVSLQNVRAVPIGPSSRKVSFTPDRTGNIRLLLQDSGADVNRRLQIVSSSAGVVQNGTVEGVQVTAGARCSLDVEFDAEFLGTVRIVADAV